MSKILPRQKVGHVDRKETKIMTVGQTEGSLEFGVSINPLRQTLDVTDLGLIGWDLEDLANTDHIAFKAI